MNIRVSDEMAKVRARAKRRLAIKRALTYLTAIVLSLWILLPIWLIASMALTTPEAMRNFPKGALPFIPFSFDTMRFFLEARGIIPGLVNSVVVALITLALSTLLAAPAVAARSIARSPAMRPKTTSSASEFDPRRLAPCRPTEEHSPTANSPLMRVSHC